MGDVGNVRSLENGFAHIAPVATALPTDTAVALNVAFVDLGLISADGITIAVNADFSEIKDISGTTVRKTRTSFELSFKAAFLETNAATLEAYFGVAPTIAAGKSTLAIKPFSPGRHAMVWDVVDGEVHKRYVLPQAEVSARDDITHKVGEAVSYGWTVTAYPDGSGNSAYLYEDSDFGA